MFLKKLYQTSPKTRHLIFIQMLKTSHFLIKKFQYKLFFKKKKNIFSNKLNKKSKKNLIKQFYFYLNFSQKSFFTFCKTPVNWYYNFISNKIYLILLTSKGSYILEPLAWGLYYKNTFYTIYLYKFLALYLPVGLNSYIKYFKNNYYYYNLIFNKNRIATSSGTFLKILYLDIEKTIYIVKLPSQKIIYINLNSYLYIGRNCNIFNNKVIQGGFFSKYFSLKQQWNSTRGISMNPVDHPNGGRTNTKNPLKTPWGKIAKKSK